jgi:hypothetical protein
MTVTIQSNHRFSKALVIVVIPIVAIAGALFAYGGVLRRLVRESLMQRVTSAHYEILCPTGALTQDAMKDFATHREALFAALDKKLSDADSNKEIRIVFDTEFSGAPVGADSEPPYSASGLTIRTKLDGHNPRLPAAADAEVMLFAVWGKPGNAKLAHWTAVWLTGDWHGAEIGMAAAQTEQRLGHKRVDVVLGNPGGQISSADDQALLGAAWISEVAELAGPNAVRKLYAARMPKLTVEAVTHVLGTNPLELDRRWQMWIYAYLAGMPAMPQDSGMHMNMPMSGMQPNAPAAGNQ